MKYVRIAFLIIVSFVVNAGCTPKEDRPNIVIIFTDDQGYADLGCFGGDHVYTPHIDQMAKEGARLTSFYVAAPLCTPSRAALMTGCYPRRVSMEPPSSRVVALPHVPEGKRFPVCLAADGHGLHPDEITIAEIAKSAGYRTGMFGKWHLGDQPEFLPTRQGFDEFFGLPYSHDIMPRHKRQEYFNFPPLPLLEGEEVIELDPDADYLTRRITERAVQFIEEHQDENFFLYVPHPIPHGPVAASAEIKKAYAEALANGVEASSKIYETAIHEIDWSVGQILSALKKHGIDENTIVLFTSDNGAGRHRKNSLRPLSGGKGSTLEGGMRMPTVIRWPKGIKAGSDTDELITAMDLLPTFAGLMGAEVPNDRIIDGKDIFPVLTAGESSPHEYFFYSHWGTLEAVRWKDWKLRIVNGKEALYNLKSDTSETQNLADQHPEIVTQLKAAMQKFDKEITANARPVGVVDSPRPLTLK
ncbi:sulfatase family protein [Marinoscillum furvescens]|uniref:Arylsulfatase A-like enzyme n=1 Tax=Marinoscillum furvescens DSM 4134 TaxID=1122208 RepID=A0A3D9L600_MARFU|nr:sulfatase [Marinoscillum furvescens]REE00146.1 arylsulfatase A-like enzyme [Marinoscillum furvescens DSM 4134]